MAGFFAKASHFVIRRPKSVFIFLVITLAIAASSVMWLQVTPSALTSIPGDLESSRALSIVTDRVGPAIITPSQIIIDLGQPNLASTPAMMKTRTDLLKSILPLKAIRIVHGL